MDAPSATPHDAVFKQSLTYAETVRDFLDIHSLVELRELHNLDTLHLRSGSFIEESLKGYNTDVLYSVQMQGSMGYLHAVTKHQGKPDKEMAFRMICYSIAAMHWHLRVDRDKLLLAVPTPFYQNEATPHPLSMCWFDMFYSPELARRVYNSLLLLADITIAPGDEIVQHRRIAILELLQKHIRQCDLILLLEQLVMLTNEEHTSKSQLVAIQSYMLQRDYTEQVGLFCGVVRDREVGGGSMMTLVQWFEEKGAQQGRQGVSQEFTPHPLSKGIPREDIAEMTNLSFAEIDKMIN